MTSFTIRRLDPLPLAEEDIRKAIAWYDAQAPGLGRAFLADVQRTQRLIGEFPEGFPRIRGQIRRADLKRFPYTILYRVSTDVIEIGAVLHERRRHPKDRFHAGQSGTDR